MRSLLALLLAATPGLSQVRTGFDELPPGPFVSHNLDGLTLLARDGHAEIDPAHARSGDRCLRILGGEERAVELSADFAVRSLTFWGERWTRHAPFALRLEARRGEAWQEVWDGTEELRVGRAFLSHVRVTIDPPAQRLRLVSTAPADTGVLIDDLVLAPPAPMRVARARAQHVVRPVLIGKPWSPLLELEVEVEGNLGELSLDAFTCALDGVGGELVGGTSLRTGRDFRSSEAFDGEVPLVEGTNRFWFAVRPSAAVTLDSSFDARVTELRVGGERVPVENPRPDGRLRVGVALRDAGDAGVHTYRIPALVRTPAGTLIAAYDLRYRSGRDLPGHIDVGVQRSTDGGRNWSPMAICMDMGAPHDRNGVGDPCAIVDPETGRVFVFALWSRGNRAWNGSGPGLTPEETGQLVVSTSDDDGVTWSAPRNLTQEVKDPAWRLLLQSPGDGIAMADGTLVVPAQYRDAAGMPWSTVLVSRDHGETWTLGTGARPNTTESRVVELPGGELMLNMRDNRGGSRAVMTSKDLGRTWVDHPSTRSALPEPVCNAGLTRGDDGRLWFVNPAVDAPPRRRMTLRASDDDGKTWPHARLLFEPVSAGYPVVVPMGQHLGVLYEGGAAAHLIFERVRVSEVVR